jgi:hypothetical protein
MPATARNPAKAVGLRLDRQLPFVVVDQFVFHVAIHAPSLGYISVANCVATSAPDHARKSTKYAKRPRLKRNEIEKNCPFPKP